MPDANDEAKMSKPTIYCKCETCGDPVIPERVHNGVCYVWHYAHCGWGHTCDGPTMTEESALGGECP